MNNRKNTPIYLAALSAFSLALVGQSSSVTTSDLKGTVTGPNGQAVAKAMVRLTSESTNQTRTTMSDESGNYSFRLVNPGSYLLTIEAEGFAPKKFGNLSLRLASTLGFDVVLNKENLSATVEVTSQGTGVDPTRTQVSTTISNDAIMNLPINRRDFTSFSLTAPGVTEANGPESRKGGAATDSGLSFAGINPRSNNIMVDGLDNNDLAVGAARTTFGQDSIQEFQIVTNGFSAEYGRAAGGTLNVITKSGGNDYQGSVFYFGRRARFDTKLPISAAQPSTTQNQYGFSVSGPIVKDQLFYFISVETLDKDDSANVAFSSNASTNAAIIAAVAAKGFTIKSGPSAYSENSTSNLIKLDYLLSSDQRLSVRYSHTNEFNGKQLDFGGQTDRSAGGARKITDDTFSLNHQWTSSSWVNDFRYMYSMRDHSLLSLDTANTPYISIIGVATFGAQRFLPQLRTEKTRQVADTFSFFTKDHSFKVGIDILETRIEGQLPLQFGGIYRFGGFPASSGIPYTDGLTAFNNNAPLVFAQNFGTPSNSPEVSYISTFFQDDWEVTKDFTVKLGLRYDREGLPDFLAKSTGQVPAAYTALATPDYTSLGANIGPIRIAQAFQQYNFNKNLTASVTNSSSRVSPRVSFSWQAASDLRLYGGYGVFSGRTQIGPLAALSVSNGTDMRTYILQGLPAFQVFSNALGNTNRRFQVEPTANPLTGIFPSLLLPGKINMSRSIQTNAGAEYNYSNTLKLTLDLVHSNGDGFLQVRDANPTVLNPYANFAAANSSTNPWVRRPDIRFGSVFLYDSSGSSSYNSATLGVNWRPQSNFALNANYTFSRALDNYIDWLTDYYPNDSYNLTGEQGPSNQDQRHRFNVTMIYSKDTWTFSMIGKLFSGRPWNIAAGADLNNNGDGGAGDRPAGVGRNSEYLPSSHNIDLRVSKSFALKGKQKLELMVDVFNATNHFTVSRVQNVAALTSTFGQPIAQSYDFRRQLQFGARFSW